MLNDIKMGFIKRHEGPGCCPGHDILPAETYNSRRSKRARARDKKMGHQLARTRAKRVLRKELFQEE